MASLGISSGGFIALCVIEGHMLLFAYTFRAKFLTTIGWFHCLTYFTEQPFYIFNSKNVCSTVINVTSFVKPI